MIYIFFGEGEGISCKNVYSYSLLVNQLEAAFCLVEQD